jgi:CRP/FNR family cyclic AMP-dependent transcriptional regulator
MISSENLRQNPYFAQLNTAQLTCLIDYSQEVTAKAGEFLFHRDDDLGYFYLVLEGKFEVIFETPKLNVAYETYRQPSELQRETVVLSLVKSGEILGWSGLVKPHKATSCVRAKTDARLMAFDCKKLLACFEQDCRFGFFMIHAAAQVIGKRLQDIYKGS